MPTSVRIEGVGSLKQVLKKLDYSVTKGIDAEASAGAQAIANNAKRRAPVDEGKLRGAIEPDKGTYLLKKVTVNIFYAPFMEFGTGKKTKIPAGLESYASQFKKKLNKGDFDSMVDSIMAWMKRKGIGSTQIYFKGGKAKKKSSLAQAIAQRQLAIHIATGILRNGVTPHPFLFPAFFDEKKNILDRIKKIIAR